MSETEIGGPHEQLDAELLNAVQWDFPLTAAPYAALGERLGISEDEVLTRLRVSKMAES